MKKEYKLSIIALFFVFFADHSQAQNYHEINARNIEGYFNNLNQTITSQVGNLNHIEVYSKNQNLTINHVGSGNQTLFIDSPNKTSKESNLNVQLIGNLNSLQIYGSNSISENMKLVQQSNHKMISIINR